MAEGYLFSFWRKGEGTVEQEKGRVTNEDGQPKLLLAPQKGRGVGMEISTKQERSRHWVKVEGERCTQGRKSHHQNQSDSLCA